MKTLAIVITAFNAKKYILETLKSFNKQLLPDGWKIKYYIGVDACVNTANVLEENNIPFYYANENVGTYILSNSLLQKAKEDNCDMFLRFDSDDIARENFLLYGITHTEQHKFVRPFYNYCTHRGKPKGTSNPTVAHGPVFMIREVLDQLGGYQPFRVACDTDLIERAKTLGYVSNIKEKLPLFFYRRAPNSLTKTTKTSKKSNFRKKIVNELERLRLQGTVKIEPVITNLTFRQ